MYTCPYVYLFVYLLVCSWVCLYKGPPTNGGDQRVHATYFIWNCTLPGKFSWIFAFVSFFKASNTLLTLAPPEPRGPLVYICIYIYVYTYGINHRRIFRSSYRKLAWVGFEPMTTEFRPDALTDWAMYVLFLLIRSSLFFFLIFPCLHYSLISMKIKCFYLFCGISAIVDAEGVTSTLV